MSLGRGQSGGRRPEPKVNLTPTCPDWGGGGLSPMRKHFLKNYSSLVEKVFFIHVVTIKVADFK